MRLSREPGEGICLYFAERRGAPFIGFNLGFTGWRLGPNGTRWFCRPTLHLGRLFEGQGRTFSRPLELPGGLVDAWRRLRERS